MYDGLMMVFSFGALAQSVRAADSLAISNNGFVPHKGNFVCEWCKFGERVTMTIIKSGSNL